MFKSLNLIEIDIFPSKILVQHVEMHAKTRPTSSNMKKTKMLD